MIEISGLIFPKLSWFEISSIVLITVAFVLSLGYSYRRLIDTNVSLKIVVGVANVLVLVGLLGFILNPKYATSQPIKVRLNTTTDDLPSVAIADYKLIDSVHQEVPPSNTQLILDPAQILLTTPQFEEINLIGDGLYKSQWKQFGHLKIDYQIPKLKPGFIHLQWNKSLNLGERLFISGELQLNQNNDHNTSSYSLLLRDPAGKVVSEVAIRPQQRFTINSVPKLSGRLEYILQVKQIPLLKAQPKRSSLQIEQSLHLNVTRISAARLAFIQSAPSFEAKQLQNWAAEQGAKVLVSTTISRQKSIHRITNFPELSSKTMGPDFFHNFDLVVFDGREFSQLTQQQHGWLIEAVKNGLGILILADQSLLNMKKDSELLRGLDLQATDKSQQVNLNWLDNHNQWRVSGPQTALKTLLAAQILVDKKQLINPQQLVVSNQGLLVIHQHDFHLGRVAVSLFRDSYQWVTRGERRQYSAYWQNLIHHISRRDTTIRVLPQVDAKLNFRGSLAKICISSKLPLTTLNLYFDGKPANQQTLLLQPSDNVESNHCGYFWPNQSGWYQIKDAKNLHQKIAIKDSWIFIEDTTRWQAQQQRLKISATLAKQQAYKAFEKPLQKNDKPIDLWWMWWFVITGSSIIWIERKVFE